MNDLFKWRIPNVSLEPQDFLLIMASDKDRVDIISEWETIIDVGDSWYYYVASQEPPQIGTNQVLILVIGVLAQVVLAMVMMTIIQKFLIQYQYF